MAERKKAFKDMTFPEKVEQIWTYYKPAVFGIILGIALIIYIIYKILNPAPDSILNVTMVNAMQYQKEGGDCFSRYLKENGYDLESETITVNAGLYLSPEGTGANDPASFQALTAMIMVGEIDILVGDEQTLIRFGSSGGLMEMEDILTPEQMERYKDRLCTVKDPETGEERVCGLKLPESNLLTADGYYGPEVWAGIPYTTGDSELATEVFSYLLGE